jgi:2-dehydropantoate 2-reductase
MRIAIMGAGGMGGYLGAKLDAAGEDVTFIARGAHLDAMRRSGLRIRGVEALHVPEPNVSDAPSQIGAVDLVLFCVKLYDTAEAAVAIAPLLHEHSMVLSVQNGVESCARLDALIGPGRALGGAAYFPANIHAPGEINFLGCIDGKASQLTDLERGRRLELDGLSGTSLRLGRAHNVPTPTPTHAAVYAALKPFKDGVVDNNMNSRRQT